MVRVFTKHTISLYISSLTSVRLYVYPSYHLLHLLRSAILGTLKRSRPYSSSSSNR